MSKFKLGDRVKNINTYWNSTVCNECNNHTEIGIKGVIINLGWCDEINGYAYKVKWDNGKFCGKSERSLELVEPLFTLPEKWCIRVTEENVEMLADWRTDGDTRGNFKNGEYNGWYLHTPMNGKNGYNQPNKEEGYTEITFEQFKKYVLKQDNNNMETQPKFKVSRQALAEVLPLVCSDYKDKINKLAQKDLFSNEIEVPEDVVRLAHKDATKKEQREWLDKYLPLPKKKKIELVKRLDCIYGSDDLTLDSVIAEPSRWDNRRLLITNYRNSGFDLIECWNTDESNAGYVYIGHFNEGNLED